MRLTQIVWTMPRISIPLAALLFAALLAFADDAAPADLKVLKLGVGAGTVSSDMANPGIDCGTDCDQSYGNVMVTLTAMAGTNSQFDGWSGGGCSRTGTCTVDMSTSKNVRANFGPDSMIPAIADFTPDGIAGAGGIKKYLVDNPKVNTPARFVAALPDAFKQNWILMTRSESLQTGTAKSPRILLPSADAFYVFTVGMTEHSSYPGSHYNAIEFMQWDPDQKNFRFHEVILDTIPAMGDVVTYPEGTTGPRFKMRTRGISIDDAKCSKCHSTRNVLNINRAVSPPTPGPYPGTDGVSPGTIVVKNKPNWDAYDSWGGAMPFNRDRIYQGSLEAVALKRLFNLWNWRDSEDANRVRQILERLQLQPPHVGATSPHRITRDITSVDDNTHIQFGFDSLAPLATTANTAAYSFNGTKDTTGTPVDQGGRYVTMRHSNPNPVVGTSNDSYGNPVNDEGRGVQLFDLLGGLDGSLNGQRIADELINHRFATGSIPIDVRPIAMAISKGTCLRIDTGTNTVMRANTMLPALTVDLTFFDARNGMNVVDVRTDTKRNWSTALPATRSTDLPRRKADLQKRNFDRTGDPYLFAPENGLIQEYGGTTFDTTISSIRRQMFRRPIESLVGVGDETIMEGRYIDRESYSYNTDRVAMYRYFLEPLGVSVGKWSMSVRGRSRAYNFADVFSTYANAIEPVLRSSMLSRTIPGLTNPDDCGQLINAINTTLSSTVLPPASGAGAVPKYTDIQRIFNKSCIECHGGLGYPPYGTGSLDFSEDEEPPAMTTPMVSPRLARAYDNAVSYVGADLASSFLHTLITRVDELCSPPAIGMMPCGGPPLSKTDIKTIERWILGPPAVSKADGDPHITTVDGTTYDFQSAGEFVLLRDEGLEVQTRQTPVSTNGPLGPNDHTGLSSCVSINTAVAVRVGSHRITYQPDIDGKPNPEGLQLRIDGRLSALTSQGIILPSGGRIMRTSAHGGIQIDAPGGTTIVMTPGYWDPYQVWFMNIDVRQSRATDGVMGVIAPNNWLPALPDGTRLGPRPRDLHQRYLDLYDRFENAWRVTDAITLFDYAPGRKTNDYTVATWPEENPQQCVAPPLPNGPTTQAPAKPLPVEVAEQHCAAIVDPIREKHCVLDVAATGEPAFAKTYLAAEKIALNRRPTAPVLGFPAATDVDLVKPVKFTWTTSADPDGDVVTYRHCVWSINERPTFGSCDVTPIKASPFGGTLFNWLLALLILLLFLAIWLLMKAKQRRALLLVTVAAFVVCLVAVSYLGAGTYKTPSKTIAQFDIGKTYYWKVIAEDGNGGVTESETRRFTTK